MNTLRAETVIPGQASAHLRTRRRAQVPAPHHRPSVTRNVPGRRSAQLRLTSALVTETIPPVLDIALPQVTTVDAQEQIVQLGQGALGLIAAAPEGQTLSELLFTVNQQADATVTSFLDAGSVTPLTFVVILGAGLLTSLSPCTLSVLPLTIGYLGGYEKDRSNLPLSATAFVFGIATTLAALGIGTAAVGKAFGQFGDGLPIGVSVLAIVMGLNLLEVLNFQLPSAFNQFDARQMNVPPLLQSYVAGLTFALAASPCSTPVLATILAYASQTGDPVTGGALLLAYTSGYVSPLLLAAFFAGALQGLLSQRGNFAWVTPASGALLISGGVYSLLSRTLPS